MSGLGSLEAAAKAVASYGLGELTFETPSVLVLLVLVAPLVWVLFFTPGGRPELLFSRGHAVTKLPRGPAFFALVAGRIAAVLAAALLVLAIAHPQVLGEPDPAEVEGIDIVVALDVSGSMRAADFKPKNRLHVAKAVIADHLLTRERDRIGMVVFAGEAFTQAPLTHDKQLLAQILEGVQTGVITDGTAIGDAVATATNRLRDSKAKSRVIILVTDGDNNAGNLAPDKAAELAASFDIKIFPILVGRGGKVPYPSGTDFFGEPRYTYMTWPTNPALLKKMAIATDGTFFSAADPAALEGSFKAILEQMDRSHLDDGPLARRPVELYPLVVLVALLAFIVAFTLLLSRGSTLP